MFPQMHSLTGPVDRLCLYHLAPAIRTWLENYLHEYIRGSPASEQMEYGYLVHSKSEKQLGTSRCVA